VNDKVQGFLEKITGNRIKEFLSGSKVPPGSEKGISFSLSDEKDAGKRSFIFWKSGSNLYARDMVSKTREVFQVDVSIWDVLPKDRAYFTTAAAPVAPAPLPTAQK
jgi:hypothetical protein